MNGICQFRLCTLTDDELIKEVDKRVDKLFEDQIIPIRSVPARPNEDLDVLIGELLIRFKKAKEGK